jgi:Arc-like DNA binding domain
MVDGPHRSQYRLPCGLYEKLKEASRKNRRPLTNELVWRLETTFASAPSGHPPLIETGEVRAALSEMTLAELGFAESDERYGSQYRIPRDLYEQLKKASAKSGWSINDEIVARLRSTFEPAWVETLRVVLSWMTIAELATEQSFDAVVSSLVSKINASVP